MTNPDGPEGTGSGPHTLEWRQQGGAQVLHAVGEFDLSNAAEFLRASDFSGDVLTVDLTEVTFMDSTALGALVELESAISPVPLRLVVKGNSQVDRLLSVSGLEDHFTVVRP